MAHSPGLDWKRGQEPGGVCARPCCRFRGDLARYLCDERDRHGLGGVHWPCGDQSCGRIGVRGRILSNVSTTGGVSGQWQTADIGVAQVAGNALDTFYAAAEDSAGKIKVVSNPDRTLVATGSWERWSIPLSEFTSSGVNVNSIKKLYLGVGDRSSPRVGGTGKLYIDDIRLEP